MATFVLVHGGWHGGWCWRKVAPLLRDAGHDVYTPTLTGLGERAHLAGPTVNLDTHIADVLGVLTCEELRDVILVGHSSGGVVITAVADRMPEAVRHLVYVDALVMPDDGQFFFDGQLEMLQTPPESRAAFATMLREKGDAWGIPPDAAQLGLTAEEDVRWVAAQLVAQPVQTFTQPLRLLRRGTDRIPRTFIACLSPTAPAPIAAAKERQLARLRAEGGWRIHALPTGHDAMVTMPQELTALLVGAA